MGGGGGWGGHEAFFFLAGGFRNLMICGPPNSAKAFLLNPLTSIYDIFCNPASSSFVWVRAEDAERIFLCQ